MEYLLFERWYWWVHQQQSNLYKNDKCYQYLWCQLNYYLSFSCQIKSQLHISWQNQLCFDNPFNLISNFSFHFYSSIFGYDVLSSFQFLSRPESEIYMDTLTGALTNPKKLGLDKNSNLIFNYIWKICFRHQSSTFSSSWAHNSNQTSLGNEISFIFNLSTHPLV